MALSELPALLRDDPALAALAGGSARVVAVSEAPRAFFLAGLARLTGRRPLVVGVPTTAEAERLAHDLRQFLPGAAVEGGGSGPDGRGAGAGGAAHDPIEMFPAWETLPFERVSPATETMGRRLRVLWRLRCGLEDPSVLPAVIIAPVRALAQRLGPHVEDVVPITVKPGQVVDRDELAERLVAAGYRREYQVEARGEFAVRGSILDVYPSTADHPVRIDLWGDEVDRLQTFSVADQRATGDLGEAVEIFPCRELLPTEAVRARAEKLIGAEPWGRAQWERLSEGMLFDGMESWLPWLTDDERLLPDLLPDEALVLLVEPRQMRDRVGELTTRRRRWPTRWPRPGVCPRATSCPGCRSRSTGCSRHTAPTPGPSSERPTGPTRPHRRHAHRGRPRRPVGLRRPGPGPGRRRLPDRLRRRRRRLGGAHPPLAGRRGRRRPDRGGRRQRRPGAVVPDPHEAWRLGHRRSDPKGLRAALAQAGGGGRGGPHRPAAGPPQAPGRPARRGFLRRPEGRRLRRPQPARRRPLRRDGRPGHRRGRAGLPAGGVQGRRQALHPVRPGELDPPLHRRRVAHAVPDGRRRVVQGPGQGQAGRPGDRPGTRPPVPPADGHARGTPSRPTRRGRRRWRRRSPTRRPPTRPRPSRTSRSTWSCPGPWTASSAATSGSARPRSPSGPRSRRCRTASRWPCSCRPRCWPTSTARRSASASPATRCGSRSSPGSSPPRRPRRWCATSRAAPSTWSSAPTGSCRRTSSSRTSASSWSTRSSASASPTRRR